MPQQYPTRASLRRPTEQTAEADAPPVPQEPLEPPVRRRAYTPRAVSRHPFAPVSAGVPTCDPAPAVVDAAPAPVDATPAPDSAPTVVLEPVLAPVETQAALATHTAQHLMSRSERRRSVAPLPTPEPLLSRAERRQAAAAAGKRRHLKAVHTGSIAAVATAILVAGVAIDGAVAEGPESLTRADDSTEPAPDDTSLLDGRTGAAGRSDVRTEPGSDAASEAPAADVAEAASTALARAAELTATETRTTPALREEVQGASAVVAELVRLSTIAEDPAAATDDVPADPDLQGAVDSAIAEAKAYFAEDDATPETESAPLTAATPQVLTFALGRAVSDLDAVLTQATTPATVDVAPARPTPAQVLAEQAAEGRADRERLLSMANATAGMANGRLASSALAPLSWASGHSLRPDAAAQLERLNIAFRARFGHDLSITDSYRSFEGQVRARATRGHLAAVPGTSNHGWGVAVDLGSGVNRFGTPQHLWMRENAPQFGWDLPGWARQNGSKPEPWHWEFEGAPVSVAD